MPKVYLTLLFQRVHAMQTPLLCALRFTHPRTTAPTYIYVGTPLKYIDPLLYDIIAIYIILYIARHPQSSSLDAIAPQQLFRSPSYKSMILISVGIGG